MNRDSFKMPHTYKVLLFAENCMESGIRAPTFVPDSWDVNKRYRAFGYLKILRIDEGIYLTLFGKCQLIVNLI
jgi:hypothetical protein